jgi:hypothetical protein
MINGDDYELLKRTEKLALFSINDGRRYEVTRVYIKPKGYDPVWWVHYPEREVISANGDQFNKDGSRFFFKLEDAMWYFEKLNRELLVKGEIMST